jgi:hypothetical protein
MKTIGSLFNDLDELKSKEIQTLMNDDSNSINNINNDNNKINIGNNKKINNWGIESVGLEPLAATLSSIFSEDKSGLVVDINDLLSFTSIII